MNVAYSSQFLEYIKQQQDQVPKEGKWIPNKSKTYPNGWVVESMDRNKSIEFRLFNPAKELKHEWINLEPQVSQVEIISHSNGTDYLIYHIMLYGISVFDLSELVNYDYYPEQSFPFQKENFKESFIWTNTFYHSNSNLIVFFGCYWACPYTGMIADFSNPMKITDQFWFDLQDLVDSSRDNFLIDDISGWKDDTLEISVEDQNESNIKKITFTVENLKEFMNKCNNK